MEGVERTNAAEMPLSYRIKRIAVKLNAFVQLEKSRLAKLLFSKKVRQNVTYATMEAAYSIASYTSISLKL